MPDFELLINGKMVPGAKSLDVINPATEELFAAANGQGAWLNGEAIYNTPQKLDA